MSTTIEELNRVAGQAMGREMLKMHRRIFLTNPFARELVGETEVPERISAIIGKCFTATRAEDEELQRWIDAEDARYKAKGL